MRPMWIRTTHEKPCPVCHRHDWCLVSANGAVAICPRTEAGSKKYLDGSGYLHIIDKSVPMPERRDEKGEDLPEHNLVLSNIASKMMGACDDEHLNTLSTSIGVEPFALRLLRVGWSATADAYTFPMFRAGQRLIGIRLRSIAGAKWAIKGSKQGLFMPLEWPSRKQGVLVCEGPTDTGAMLGLGFNVVGRPSAMGSHALVEEAVHGRVVCIMSDADRVGLDSSIKLANHLLRSGVCSKVSVLIPPSKDAREWRRQGVTKDEVRSAIAAAFQSDGPYYCPSTSQA